MYYKRRTRYEKDMTQHSTGLLYYCPVTQLHQLRIDKTVFGSAGYRLFAACDVQALLLPFKGMMSLE